MIYIDNLDLDFMTLTLTPGRANKILIQLFFTKDSSLKDRNGDRYKLEGSNRNSLILDQLNASLNNWNARKMGKTAVAPIICINNYGKKNRRDYQNTINWFLKVDFTTALESNWIQNLVNSSFFFFSFL